jgi:hypothetical protein
MSGERPLKVLNISGLFRQNATFVIAGHSRPKDGVATLAYVPAIHALLLSQAWMPATSTGGETGFIARRPVLQWAEKQRRS